MKVYLKQNYRRITMGSIHNVVRVQGEVVDGVQRFYVEVDKAGRELLDNLGYIASGSPIVSEAPTKKPASSHDKSPDEFYCRDHKDHHVRGDVDYYGCIEKYLSGEWGKEPETHIPAKVTPDLRTHTMSTNQVKELAEKVQDVGRLKALYEGEKAHPQYEGGRKGVLSVLSDRMTVLQK